MNRTSRFGVVVFSLVMLAAVLVLASATAQAEVRPFKIQGSGIVPDGIFPPPHAPQFHWIVGNASYLGAHYGEGSVQAISANPQPDGTITGDFGSGSPFVFTSRRNDADRLVCYYGRPDYGAPSVGTFTLTIEQVRPDGSLLVTAEWDAYFVVQPESTGQFAGVTGSWRMFAKSAPFVLGSPTPVAYSWESEEGSFLTFP